MKGTLGIFKEQINGKRLSELKKKLNNQKTELSIIQHKIKSYSANT